jgi:4-hydroxy 2-oxovalerate aldolase
MIDLIRVACYIKEVDKALELVNQFNILGYETSINIMAVSNAMEYELKKALAKINDSNVDIVYIVDSYGCLLSEDIIYLTQIFKEHLPNKFLGIHAHNNLQMAFSNTFFASNHGVLFLDSSIYGMGRAAGNCPTELLIGTLRSTKYDIKPILKLIQDLFVPLREKVEWGYLIPYTITGLLNEHPRSAMRLRGSKEKDSYLEFYNLLTSVETMDDTKKN